MLEFRFRRDQPLSETAKEGGVTIGQYLEKLVCWYTDSDIFKFYCSISKEERQQFPESFKTLIENYTKDNPVDSLYVYGNSGLNLSPEERSQYNEKILLSLKYARANVRLKFFGLLTPEEREQYQNLISTEERQYKDIVEEAIMKAIESRDLKTPLEFLGNLTPNERKNYEVEVKMILAIPDDSDLWFGEGDVAREAIKIGLREGKVDPVGGPHKLRFLGNLSREERKPYQNKLEIYLKSDEISNIDKLNFFSGKGVNSEERKERKEEIEQYLSESGPLTRFDFFSKITPEERAEYQEMIREDLKEILASHDNYDLYSGIRFLSTLTFQEREEYWEEFNQLIDRFLKKPDIDLLHLRMFTFLTPEQRLERQEKIKEVLRGSVSDQRLEFWGSITPEERKSGIFLL